MQNPDSALQWGTFIAACIAAGATSVYAYFSYRQWRATETAARAAKESADATKRYAEIAADTAEKQLRAYVNVMGGNLDPVSLTPHHQPMAVIAMKNLGQTPAYNVRAWHGIFLGEHPLGGDLPTHGGWVSEAILPPGGEMQGAVRMASPLDPRIISLVGDREHTIYVYGQIEYKDVFNEDRHTRYRFIYGGRIRHADGRLTPDNEGNEAD